MTCIVGLVHKGAVYMGGDSAGVGGQDVKIRLDPKVFIVKRRFIIGFTNSFRMGQLLRFSLKPALQLKTQSDYEYMCTSFIDSVRRCFSTGGYMGKDKEDGEREEGGHFLVGYRSVLYEIAGDFQVGINNEPYCSIGCGDEYAHGSLFTSDKLNLCPKKKIICALETATHFSGAVRPPFIILKLPPPNRG